MPHPGLCCTNTLTSQGDVARDRMKATSMNRLYMQRVVRTKSECNRQVLYQTIISDSLDQWTLEFFQTPSSPLGADLPLGPPCDGHAVGVWLASGLEARTLDRSLV